MCAIGGYISFGDKVPTHEQITNLLVAMQVRGKDATGFAFHTDNGIEIRKLPLESSKFVLEKEWNSMEEMPPVMILHTRAATQGPAAIPDNNHPLKGDGFALVHNGVIQNEAEFGIPRTEVDSKAIVKAFENNAAKSLEERIKSTTESLFGGFANAVLLEDKPDTLILWRHTNPIVLGYDEVDDILYFASTASILEKMSPKWILDLGPISFPRANLLLHELSNDTALIINRKKEISKFTIQSKRYTPTRYTTDIYGDRYFDYYGGAYADDYCISGVTLDNPKNTPDYHDYITMICPECNGLTHYYPKAKLNHCEFCGSVLKFNEKIKRNYKKHYKEILEKI